MFIARVILDALLVVLILTTGGGKLLQLRSSLAIRDSLNLGNRAWRAIGTLELIAVVGLIVGIWVPAAGLAASVGVVLLMVGAIITRVRAGQRTPSIYVVDIFVLLVGVASIVLHSLAL